jgi:small-conductance mechanosensitive channel
VINYTKDFSNMMVYVGISYRENVDEVMKVIEDLGREMAEDQSLGADIVGPLETQGVSEFRDSAVVIRAKMMVRAGTQWGLKREFNRRLKNRFDELGIEIPFPQQTISFSENKDASAVAGRPAANGQPAAQTKARIIPDRGDDADGDGGD